MLCYRINEACVQIRIFVLGIVVGYVCASGACASSFKSAGSLGMPLIFDEGKVKILRRLRSFVQRAEELVELNRGYALNVCCLHLPYDCFYLIRDVVDCKRESSLECW